MTEPGTDYTKDRSLLDYQRLLGTAFTETLLSLTDLLYFAVRFLEQEDGEWLAKELNSAGGPPNRVARVAASLSTPGGRGPADAT